MRAVGATRELNKQSGEKHGAQRNTGRSGPRELAILMRGKSTGHAENTGGRGLESLKLTGGGKARGTEEHWAVGDTRASNPQAVKSTGHA